ncbi:uncharacterized protein LOC124703580 isoform X2 [Lolium rigidum]|uniref:uncharacterized protein LOC124703580 isoform X1 n=1 Tax=Lolium rigidum TaxID=89674 RepID=UPI001F5DDCA3|nr:uncharacterized protein LOC124703580 isoform X1 [Lolium rigidum]XP_047091746.1 uncharacterized protein LOC124703580 isoform X2 [Lolium rigidum]
MMEDVEVVLEAQDRQIVVQAQDGQAVVQSEDDQVVFQGQDSQDAVQLQDNQVIVQSDGQVVVHAEDGQVLVEPEDDHVLVESEDDHVLVESEDDQIYLEAEQDLVQRERFLVIGQEFSNVETCRRAIKDMAIALHFQLRVVKSDRSRFIAKCSTEGCPWRVHVAKCHDVPTFTVRTLQAEHTCEGVQDLHHQQATVNWVARSVEARLRDNPQIKPKEILQDIRDQHGVAVSYMQAWRGKERSMAAVHGTLEDGYRLLPAYCEQIGKTNPGSVAVYKGSVTDNSFQRLFVSFRASIYGFLNACRPLLEIDKAELKGKYLGTLLCASAVDADHMMFPVAFAVVDSESDDNWMWFISELRKMLGVNTDKMPVLTILSERHPQVVEAVELNFPTAFHGFCLRYVSENFREEFKSPKLLNLFWSAFYALTTTEFDSKVKDMMQVQDVMQWFQHFPPNLWAVSYFEGMRYGHFNLGITEILYNWALECHELPIVQTIEYIRHQLTCWFSERYKLALSHESVLVPSAEKLISESISDSGCYQVLRANKVEFEIVSSERTNIVDTETRFCSCRRWQIYGIPCAHAAAALLSCGEDPRQYTHDCFSVLKYRETYSQRIYPIPDRIHWSNSSSGPGVCYKSDVILRPPKIRRPPGRPKMKILKMESLKRPKRIVQCGRCHLLGHSQKKCSSRS